MHCNKHQGLNMIVVKLLKHIHKPQKIVSSLKVMQPVNSNGVGKQINNKAQTAWADIARLLKMKSGVLIKS